MSIKRIASLATIVASLVAIAGIAPAGADDFLIHPGQIRGTSTFGFAQVLDESTGTFMFIQVQSGLVTFRPHRPGGPPLVTMNTGVANISISNSSDSGFGCWIFPQDHIVVGSGLNATLTLDTSDPSVLECPGDPVSTSALGAPPAIGPSGLVWGLTEPLQFTITWAPSGPITTTRSSGRMSCKPFQTTGEGVSQSVDSTASGSATGTFTNSGPFYLPFANAVGDFGVGSSVTNISGPPSAGCGPF